MVWCLHAVLQVCEPDRSKNGPYIFTPAEIDCANGWPVIPGAPTAYVDSVPSVFKQLSYHQRALLAGNGMHLHTLAAWLMYVHAHCIRRSSLALWSPRSSMPAERGPDQAAQAAQAEDDSNANPV